MENRPRIEGDSVYGGSMTPEEFLSAEFHVQSMPEYEKIEVPQINVKLIGREFQIHPFNSSVVRYGQEPTMYDHVLLPIGKDPMKFYNVFEKYKILAKTMLQEDFPMLMHYEEPLPEVKQALENAIRGNEAMASIIERILDGE